jgi:hypothetical protein
MYEARKDPLETENALDSIATIRESRQWTVSGESPGASLVDLSARLFQAIALPTNYSTPDVQSTLDLVSQWLGTANTAFPGVFPAIITAIITGSIALIALRTNAAVNIRNKRVDVIMNCNARYEELYKFKIVTAQAAISNTGAKSKNNSRINEDITSYFRRFWGMKSDQLDYWLAGYIDPETILSWFMSTIDAIHEPVDAWKSFNASQNGGWDAVKEFHKVTNPRLFQVIEMISQPSFSAMDPDTRYAELFDLFQSIERGERTLIRMLTRNNHARLTMGRFESKLSRSIATVLARKRGREFANALGMSANSVASASKSPID